MYPYYTQGRGSTDKPYRRAWLSNKVIVGAWTLTLVGVRFGDMSRNMHFLTKEQAEQYINDYKKRFNIRKLSVELN